MAKATTGSHNSPAPRQAGPWQGAWKGPTTRLLDWRKRMSDTVAYALLAYTALQILVTMHVMSQGNASTLPMFALVVLVAAIIPLFRHYERHWEALDDAAAANPALRPLFRRDQMSVWLFAVGLPFAVTGLFKAYGALAS
jgi:hypothetical protein